MTKVFAVCMLILVLVFAGCKKKASHSPDETDQSEQELEVIESANGPDYLEKVIKIWSQGNKNVAVDELLQINWQKKPYFSDESVFNLIEQEYVLLSSSEQADHMNTLTKGLKPLCFYVIELGREAANIGNIEKAKLYFQAVYNCGEFLTENPNGVKIIQLIGKALMKKSSQELNNLK